MQNMQNIDIKNLRYLNQNQVSTRGPVQAIWSCYNPFWCDPVPAGWRWKIRISLLSLWCLFKCGLILMFEVDLKMEDQYKLAVFFILLILTLIVTSMLMFKLVGLVFVWKMNLILMLFWCCCWFNVDVDLIFLFLIWWLCCICFYAGVDKIVDWINSKCLGLFRLPQSRD